MAIMITPNIQSAAATAPSAPRERNRPAAGQVITAEVLQVLGNDQVQIAIGNQTIEAATQVPLQAGQTLQLQVSQTPSGIGLSIVNQPSTPTGQAGQTTQWPARLPMPLTLSPSLAASLAANLTTDAVTPHNPLTPLETLAVSVAAQTAVTQQTSLAPLFADLGVAAGLPSLPPQVQQAVAQVLAQQILSIRISPATLSSRRFSPPGCFWRPRWRPDRRWRRTASPDLKAALIVLRQALTIGRFRKGPRRAGTATPASASTLQPGCIAGRSGDRGGTIIDRHAVRARHDRRGRDAGTHRHRHRQARRSRGRRSQPRFWRRPSELIAGASALPATAATELVPRSAFGATSAAAANRHGRATCVAQGRATAIAQEILDLAPAARP